MPPLPNNCRLGSAGCEVIRHEEGHLPWFLRAKLLCPQCRRTFIDTAGRLHNKPTDERTGKYTASSRDLEARMKPSCWMDRSERINQAKVFETANVTGVVLTKLTVRLRRCRYCYQRRTWLAC
ncbi:MAG: hypothetical protein ACLRXQ_05395 [Phascolarctobacterium faecium]